MDRVRIHAQLPRRDLFRARRRGLFAAGPPSSGKDHQDQARDQEAARARRAWKERHVLFIRLGEQPARRGRHDGGISCVVRPRGRGSQVSVPRRNLKCPQLAARDQEPERQGEIPAMHRGHHRIAFCGSAPFRRAAARAAGIVRRQPGRRLGQNLAPHELWSVCRGRRQGSGIGGAQGRPRHI